MCPDRTAGGLRVPTTDERQLIARLLAANFTGAAELRPQLSVTLVDSIDDDGSLRLNPEGASPADVSRRIPVEASYPDADGMTVHVLLHVIDGLLDELEVFREDSLPVLRPAASALDLAVDPWYE